MKTQSFLSTFALLTLLSLSGCEGQPKNQVFAKKNIRHAESLNQCDVIGFIGDSNMMGAATIPGTIPTNYQGPRTNSLIYYKVDISTTDNGVWEYVQASYNEWPGYARTNPYYSWTNAFAYQADQIAKKRIAIVKLGVSGASLVPKAGGLNDWTKVGNELYPVYVTNFYGVGVAKLTAYRPKLKAMVIRLGTNDAVPAAYNLDAFKAAIPELVRNLRADLNAPNLPIYWVQVRSDLYLDNLATIPQANVDAIRAALLDCTDHNSPAYINNFTLLDYDNNTTYPIGPDFVHFTASAYDTQGLYEANLVITP